MATIKAAVLLTDSVPDVEVYKNYPDFDLSSPVNDGSQFNNVNKKRCGKKRRFTSASG